jgi:hypothetical protein
MEVLHSRFNQNCVKDVRKKLSGSFHNGSYQRSVTIVQTHVSNTDVPRIIAMDLGAAIVPTWPSFTGRIIIM